MTVLRPYRPDDLPAVMNVCLRTAAHGSDASDLVSDPELPGLLYAKPYVVREPDLCWVVEEGNGQVAGYILGTCDSRTFATWSEREWFPLLQRRFPPPPPEDDGVEASLWRAVHEGYRAPECAADHPAHLHIDLLPSLQAQGWGRRLLEVFSDALRARGVPGVHLGVGSDNLGAFSFYERTGFRVLERHATWTEMGMVLSPRSRVVLESPSTPRNHGHADVTTEEGCTQ